MVHNLLIVLSCSSFCSSHLHLLSSCSQEGYCNQNCGICREQCRGDCSSSGHGSLHLRGFWRIDWGPITGWTLECSGYMNVCVGHPCHILSNNIFHHSNGITKCRFRRRHPRGDRATTKSSFTISLMTSAYSFINTMMQIDRARHDYFTGA